MIELILLEYLQSKTEIPCVMETPDLQKTGAFYLIQKTGSGKTNHIKRATVAFQSWAGSMYEAAQMNETLKEIIEQSVVLNEIVSVRLNSDYNFTDTATKHFRYQAVFDFVHY